MRHTVLTICSYRKRDGPSPGLRARDLDYDLQSRVARKWRKLVGNAPVSARADEVYGGRAFREAEEASRQVGGDFWVISGGLGLIPSNKQIPSYSITMSRGSPDCIATKVRGGDFSSSDWWRQINLHNKSKAPIAELVRSGRRKLFFIALSGPYADLVSEDLMSLSDSELKRVRLFGRKLTDVLSRPFHSCVMPYDERFDGPESPIPGTLSDSAQRAMRHFVQEILPKADGADVSHHRDLVTKAFDGIEFPTRPQRAAKSDNEIIGLIQDNWDRARGRSSLMLRYLRDVEQVACEQSRFRKLFEIAKSEMMEPDRDKGPL